MSITLCKSTKLSKPARSQKNSQDQMLKLFSQSAAPVGTHARMHARTHARTHALYLTDMTALGWPLHSVDKVTSSNLCIVSSIRPVAPACSFLMRTATCEHMKSKVKYVPLASQNPYILGALEFRALRQQPSNGYINCPTEHGLPTKRPHRKVNLLALVAL